MNVVQMIGVLSLAGAFLFFLSGYFFRGLRPAKASYDKAQHHELINAREELSACLESQDSRREELAAREAAQQGEATQLRHELQTYKVKADELDRVTKHAANLEAAIEATNLELVRSQRNADNEIGAELHRTKIRLAKQEVATAQKVEELEVTALRVAELEVIAQRVEELTAAAQQSEELRALVNQSISSDDDAQTKIASYQTNEATMKKKIAELNTSLRESKAESERAIRLTEELAEARADVQLLEDNTVSINEHQALKAKQRNMLIQAKMMQVRVSELEHYADEAVGLREKAREVDQARAELTVLRKANRDLEATIFSAGLHREVTASAESRPSTTNAQEVEVGTSLDRFLHNVIEAGQAQSVVVSDEQGLLLSSSGESNHEALAVVASLVQQLGNRASELLPLTDMRSAEFFDANGASIRTHKLEIDDSLLTVTVLRKKGMQGELDDVALALTNIIMHEERA